MRLKYFLFYANIYFQFFDNKTVCFIGFDVMMLEIIRFLKSNDSIVTNSYLKLLVINVKTILLDEKDVLNSIEKEKLTEYFDEITGFFSKKKNIYFYRHFEYKKGINE